MIIYELERYNGEEWEKITYPIEDLNPLLHIKDKAPHRIIKTTSVTLDIDYKTIRGKWWLFYGNESQRSLTDEEAVAVIWDVQIEIKGDNND